MYRRLDSEKIVATIAALHRRILARFPDSSLARVCAELETIARANTARVERLAEPNWRLRLGVGALIALGAVLFAWVVTQLVTNQTTNDVFGRLQGLEAVLNIFVLVGAGLAFLVTYESRAKRSRALADLHELRSIVHVIDMHQLTKDPTAPRTGLESTNVSPPRDLTPLELTRYLDYCSEMLSLCAKVSALYAQSSTDPIVIDAVNDLERLATNLRGGIWQKITLVRSGDAVDAP